MDNRSFIQHVIREGDHNKRMRWYIRKYGYFYPIQKGHSALNRTLEEHVSFWFREGNSLLVQRELSDERHGQKGEEELEEKAYCRQKLQDRLSGKKHC